MGKKVMSPKQNSLQVFQTFKGIGMISVLPAISLSLAWPAPQVSAQQQEGTPLRVPPGTKLKATLDGKTAEASVQADAGGEERPPAVEREDNATKGTVIIRLRPWNASPSSPMRFEYDQQGFSGSLDSVHLDEEFAIDVHLDKAKLTESAAGQFAEVISVDVKLPEGGRTQSLKLRHRGGGNYSSTAPLTARSGGGQTRSVVGLEWEGGGVGSLKVKSGSIVTVAYEDSFVDFKVYDTPLQLTLGRFNDAFYGSREALQFRLMHDGLSPRELLEWRHPDTSRERRAALELLRLKQPGRKQDLEDRLRYVDHYFNIIESGEYQHDSTKLKFAEVYSGLVQNNNDDVLGLNSRYPPGRGRKIAGMKEQSEVATVVIFVPAEAATEAGR
jgi:hypothetical protein